MSDKKLFAQLATALLISFVANKVFGKGEDSQDPAAGSTLPKNSATDYVDRFGSLAADTETYYRVPAIFTLAQGGLESSWGNSDVAVNANNHFGIKADSAWKGPSYKGYRKYSDVSGGYFDHAKFLTTNKRYAAAFNTTDPVEFSKAVAAAGYSELPSYSTLMKEVITLVKNILRV